MTTSHLQIHEAAWVRISSGDDDQRLRAVLTLSAIAFSAEAIPVVVDADGQQTAVCFAGHCRLVGLHRELDITVFETVDVAGRPHIIFITPPAAKTQEERS